MTDLQNLSTLIQDRFSTAIAEISITNGELTVELLPQYLSETCLALRDESPFQFVQLIDLCGVDYSQYGISQWQTQETTLTGFSRAVEIPIGEDFIPWQKGRFAVVYHLLSLVHNQRMRLRVFPPEETLQVDSVLDIWPSADWYEREAFDMFGIVFRNHPDLRRILTDYGFIGHPFRKDFPLIGQVEMRYDATLKRCIYEPVSIQPRTLVPKVIREDSRYIQPETEQGSPNG
jgi:NADH-quinone oxidoreductase subunit C